MTYRALAWLLPVAALACTPPSKSIGAGESSSAGGSGSATEDATDSAVSQPTSNTESDSVSGVATMTTGGTESGDDTLPETMTTGGTETGDDMGTTGEPGECDIVVVVNNAAQGKMEPDDCGFILLADALAAWEAAQQCALDHAEGGLAFTLIAEQQGIDSEVHVGFAGAQGEVYAASRFFSDANGLVPGTHITGGPCNIVAVDGCNVTQGDLCLDCVDSPNPMTICETP